MITHKDGTLPTSPAIFVFGSNLAGRHGAGAAKIARLRFGAVPGVGRGRTGDAYAIPTKNAHLGVLSLEEVRRGVNDFLRYAKDHQELRFFVTRVGCGLAGFTNQEIAPMFREATENCYFPEEWGEFFI
ncbi:hypothetical protein HAQ01_05075 [Acidithiobacillus thiooxidans]|uniref:Macro domain-containing protein n=1 Tax=Acidithiobacillus sulfurivorans TaxID=1958756 RepID=A0ABS6A0Y2_9PROT|nr:MULTISPECIES: hypothetical protein [Acidithiobacillus]MBU2741856.1 hypothetical protein [Acidithiobacillus albertensis]MBU2760940.1 hypothetical protein [Acidithiobacillus sulfurivorans]MBU2792765.1 hypothetical protein [Acidithiobacillus thiooxidans]